jgi:Holliday junction DNA helicase RuvA
MIGFIFGEVLFSDGNEVIIQTNSGVGYQVFYNQVLIEGKQSGIYVSHIIKEDSETMYGFHSLRSKKMFEMLLSVKGIGPKSAYSLISNIGVNEIINAVLLDSKTSLTKVPGLGAKGAAQIILDLSGKIDKIKMYSDSRKIFKPKNQTEQLSFDSQIEVETISYEEPMTSKSIGHNEIMNDTLMACKELGFKEDKVISIAQKILSANHITKPEQLIHLVLKEI